jgi:hypothetical protein
VKLLLPTRSESPLALGLVLFSLGLALSAGADYVSAGYLCWVGPLPLRWQPATALHPEVLLTLPPLVILEQEPASSPDTSNSAPSSGGKTMDPGPAVGGAKAPSQELLGPALGGDKVLDPGLPGSPEWLQTLLYSPGGTNRLSTVVMPLNFVPPAAPANRSSSATYSTDKP